MMSGGYRSQDIYRREVPSVRLSRYDDVHHHPILAPSDEMRRSSTSNSWPDRPPGSPLGRPNFTIELRCSDQTGFSKADVEALLVRCNGEGIDVSCYSNSSWRWCCRRWTDAVAVMVFLWRTRLGGLHSITPLIKSLVSCDNSVLRNQLREIFIEHVNGHIEGDLLDKWQKKVALLLDELSEIEATLKKHNPINVFTNLSKQREGLKSGIVMIEKRILEFKSSMTCILDHLEGYRSFDSLDGEPRLFKFGKHIDFVRVHFLIKRECRRLEDGLPIYAFRQEILEHVNSQQVMLLIGETGSGKSTQLAQFLADSDFSAMDSIVCTQPRKLAAVSLAQRVHEECSGCYKDTSIVSYPTYSSSHDFKSKVIYMTDHCLLQHYMRDKSLSGISCIIIDEAHERSLNTDLLLAMIKSLLCRRLDMRLIIMSATADADKLAEYFFGCETFHVVGRNFPVDIEYVPSASVGACSTGTSTLNVSEVLKVVADIHKTEPDGAILAFLTSQMEVEWACETFQAPHAVTLPLHGKLSNDDQRRVFLDYPGRRKVIFSTNLAETSLTIPGVKYVVDTGKMKLSRFEPATSMNVLKVCSISQSSAEQRAGRAGRTAPGKCYRLYSQEDFEMMPAHQEPEIRRVHLGVAVLRIVSMGIRDVSSFDFIDAPDADAIDKAIQNLIQLEAVSKEGNVLELTDDGKKMVRLGIEPRLGKLILQCFDNRLGKEGVVLAAVTANASTIFCRVGNEEDKHKSDCYKVQFCHRDGDLFTMLAVYKEWEAVPREKRNRWCWENSINAKSMRRCEDMVLELEHCLRSELAFITPTYWCWNPLVPSEHDKNLKKAILSSLAENVAMHSGYDQLGYEVALTGKYVQLHPSCSLLVFSQRPSWIIFVEILSISTQYLVCATAVDYEDFSTISHPLLLEASKMQHRKLQQTVLNGYGTTILKRFCGKFNSYQHHIVSSVRKACMDERIGIEVNVDQKVVHVYAPSEHMENVCGQVKSALDYERKWLQNECAEKFLFREGRRVTPSFALFGSGAEIKHLELDNKTLTVDVFCSDANADAGNGKKFLMYLEDYSSSGICAIQRHTSTGQDSENMTRWGRITFLTPDAAQQAVELSPVTLNGAIFEIVPSMSGSSAEHSMHSFSAVKVKLHWPRRRSKGCAVLRCEEQELIQMLAVLSTAMIDGRIIYCELCTKSSNGIVIKGLDTRLSESDILDELRNLTNLRILDFFLFRGKAEENPPYTTCEDELHKAISNLMPKRSPQDADNVRVQIYPPEPKDAFMKALVTFDGSLHFEAATALEQIEGTVLPGCLPWQKIKCQQLFHSSVSCSVPVYCSIRTQLNSLIASYRRKRGVNCVMERNDNGSYRVKISANGTKTVAELRRPLELLMRGRTVQHASITPPVIQLLYSREGTTRMNSIKQETGTHILFDKHNQCIRIFGSTAQVDNAEHKLIQSLLNLYSRKELDIHLRGNELLPPDLMKEVVKEFGPDLDGLKEKVPGAEFTLNTRLHVISVHGTKEQKEKAESLIHEIAQMTESSLVTEDACPICLCKVEDAYRLENCGHVFCRTCLVEQCESAIRNRDSFPIRCTNAGCKSEFLLTDLRSLFPSKKLDELFRASLAAYVAESGGRLRFCPSPDCPSVYRVAEEDEMGEHFLCGACYGETCRRCHLEYHSPISCETYKEFKEDPDSSLREWSKGKEHVKNCPVCSYTIEKIDGCNHIECKCGGHICWVCLDVFRSSDDCYSHLRAIHSTII